MRPHPLTPPHTPPTPPHPRRPKGFGFIELSDPRDADEALARLDGTMVGDRRVEVGWGKGWVLLWGGSG
jgi:hypothetical protein